jgi:site-specific recombinase XerD
MAGVAVAGFSTKPTMPEISADAGIHKLATPHTLRHSFCDAPA